MLEPREADVPVLFLFLVVLPLVAYILLGKWSETAKKRERINLLAQLAADEALKAEAMTVATATVIPLVSTSTNGLHLCARCFSPATTRCSRCKFVRYCSGKCQIIHWRQVHKQECQQLDNTSSSSSPMAVSVEDSALLNQNLNSQLFGYNNKQAGMEREPSDNMIHPSISVSAFATMDYSTVAAGEKNSMPERRTADKRISRKSNREMLRREDAAIFDSHEEISSSWATNSTFSNNVSSKEASRKHKSRTSDSVVPSNETTKHNFKGSNVYAYGQATARSNTHESHYYQSQHGNMFQPRSSPGVSSSYSGKHGTNAHENEKDFISNGGGVIKEENVFNDDSVELNCYSEMTTVNGSVKAKDALNPLGTKNCKLPKSCMKVVGEQPCMKVVSEQSCCGKDRKGPIADESKVARVRDTISAQGSNGVAKMGIMKMMGLKKSTKHKQDSPEILRVQNKKLKMLFPYEEFVKFFQCEAFDLLPRGLVNCGNSCYANAVLQCLTCTKPLIIYLLHRSHSRACCGKDWCLMCELEQHVMMLKEIGGPLSPSRILLHMRSINCQIGDGSQEDAHEFLRLLVASMQSICLEKLGGESKVDPRLQETTFIQHTFGGRLRSKVKCLRCYHESERYENIMDLTLEIFGWVESLEDALTQFTTSEDLDGENMYRCGRCAAYVRARKQLSIHEAPNILTIVLKRFQVSPRFIDESEEGRYGKINKCITFPEFLDMIPFMTRTGDIPPLYMLYAVVVHLDTQNASFSGHYVSYVKDMQGSWFRVDDTEVHPVPMSQVMSEGAYILFYMRSCPRPQRSFTGKAMRQQVPPSARHHTPETQKLSRDGQSNSSRHFVGPESNHTSNGSHRTNANKNILPEMERYGESISMEFSDATSSDWSLFTSSDEASFTTESTRDSFSTVDYGDTCNVDPISSIFNTLYSTPESTSHNNAVCCRTFSNSRPQTRFISEEKGFVLDSYLSTQSQKRVQRGGETLRQVSDSSTEFSSNSMSVNYESNQKYSLDRTSGHCKL